MITFIIILLIVIGVGYVYRNNLAIFKDKIMSIINKNQSSVISLEKILTLNYAPNNLYNYNNTINIDYLKQVEKNECGTNNIDWTDMTLVEPMRMPKVFMKMFTLALTIQSKQVYTNEDIDNYIGISFIAYGFMLSDINKALVYEPTTKIIRFIIKLDEVTESPFIDRLGSMAVNDDPNNYLVMVDNIPISYDVPLETLKIWSKLYMDKERGNTTIESLDKICSNDI